MGAPIEDVSSLPGQKVSDQDEAPIGEVKAIYQTEDGFPAWVAVEARTGITGRHMVLVPLARLSEESGRLRTPYSKSHLLEAPKLDDDDDEGISAELDRELRVYYGIGTGDQEMWSDNKGYATLVPDEPGEAKRVDDPDELETPNADKRTEETKERARDPGGSELREVSAEAVFEESKDDG